MGELEVEPADEMWMEGLMKGTEDCTVVGGEVLEKSREERDWAEEGGGEGGDE